MDVNNVIDEVLGTSKYVGDFSFDELVKTASSQAADGVAVSEESDQKFIIIFEKGELTGVILIDEKGALYGEQAALMLQNRDHFELFATEPSIVGALAARSRVFDTMHILRRLSNDLPSIGGRQQRPGVLCLVIQRDGALQSGMRVTVRKGRQIIGSDTTTEDGKACFKLLSGRYDCVVLDRTQESYTFMIDFKDRYTESIIDIGG